MKMLRVALLTGGLSLLTACGEGNVYELRTDEAYRKLRDAKVTTESNAIFGRLKTNVSGDGAGTIYWRPAESNRGSFCEANIVPEGETSSRITAYCGSDSPYGGDAASGMLHNMHRQAVIEHIDAALTDRPFDYSRRGSTAARWPKDPRQADASLGKATSEALKMQRETEQMIQDMEAQKN
jgi:hypothetical protein